MKKKMLSLALAAAMLVGIAIPALAVNGATENVYYSSPTGGQTTSSNENVAVEIVTDNVVTGGYIQQKGSAETRPLEEIDYPVIKITTLNMSSKANAAVDEANPGATETQKSAIMTQSGLKYNKNAVVNQVAEGYYSAPTTGDFVDHYQMPFIDNVVFKVQGQLNNYSVLQIMDISANEQAISLNKTVHLNFSAPGVKVGNRVMVAHIQGNSLTFVSAQAGDGSISFDVDPSNLGVFVLLTYAKQ